ncbi:MAG: hypothetical protein IJQ55_02755 [Alphaproteobacteria bacterium]|nr:hypothetical protein [Alphaproteobacteria bacterium]
MVQLHHFLMKNLVPRRSLGEGGLIIFLPTGASFYLFSNTQKSSKVILLKKAIFILLLNFLWYNLQKRVVYGKDTIN